MVFQVQLSDDVDEVGVVKFKGGKDATWMFRWKLGSMVRINGLFHLLKNGVYWGYNPLILTFDPKCLGHPSRKTV